MQEGSTKSTNGIVGATLAGTAAGTIAIALLVGHIHIVRIHLQA